MKDNRRRIRKEERVMKMGSRTVVNHKHNNIKIFINLNNVKKGVWS